MKKSQEILITKLENIPQAAEEDVKIKNLDTDYKAIINPEDNKTFAIVSKDYQLIQHSDVYKKVIADKRFKIGDAAIFKSGRVMMLELIPAKETKIELIKGSKDFIQPRVRIFNSYDASRALSVQGFGMRLICKNGATAPGFKDRYHKAHAFKNIKLEKLNDSIELAMNTWATSQDQMSKAAHTKVNVKYTLSLIGKFPKKYMDETLKKIKGENATVYDIWNALTNTLSHQMKSNVQTGTLVKYQQRVNKVFNALNDPNAEPVLKGKLPTEKTGEERTSQE